ncbi:hypothetical protein KKD40_04310 [Candidatus Micrarchaeota archaeon]|nr:hypothetical protein [Candidatus Micrarchaeota archaeon]
MAESVQLSKPTVLYLEDTKLHNDFTTKSLQKYGLEIISCASVQEATTTLLSRSGSIDMVVTDVYWETKKERTLFKTFLKEITKQKLPVVFVTGAEWEDIPDRITEHVVMKPARQKEIAAAVLRALGDKAIPQILLVEDDYESRETTKQKLFGEGFFVTTANDPDDALEILETRHIDIVITDVVFRNDNTTFAEFVENVIDSGYQCIVFSNASYVARGWLEVYLEKMDGVAIINKGDEYLLIPKIREFFESRDNRQKCIDHELLAKFIHIIANPKYHIKTPIEKAGIGIEHDGIWIRMLRETLRSAFRQEQNGGPSIPKHELDVMVSEYLRVSGKLGNNIPNAGNCKKIRTCRK